MHASQSLVSEPVQLVRSLQRFLTHQKAQKREEYLEVLRLFDEGIGKELLAEALTIIPALKDYSFQFLPGGPLCVLQRQEDTVSRATAACAWSCNHKESNLGTSLSSTWDLHHSLIESEMCDVIEKPGKKVSPCVMAGRCIHQGQGKRLSQFRTQMCNFLKKTFQTTLQKQSLLDGMVFLHVHSIADTLPDGPAPSALDSSEVWLSVALMYQKPYRPTFHRVLPVRNPEPWVHASASRRVYVEAEQGYLESEGVMWEACSHNVAVISGFFKVMI